MLNERIQHFHFFGNREVTSLNFMLAFLHFAEGLILVFIPIYLWELGFPLWKIIYFYWTRSIFFIIFAS